MVPSHEAEARCLFLFAFLHGPTDGEDAPDDETGADDAVCDKEQLLPDWEFIAQDVLPHRVGIHQDVEEVVCGSA